MMSGESAPTNLHASIGLRFIGESNTWLFLFLLTVPCFLGSIFVMMFLIKETKGKNIEEEPVPEPTIEEK